MIKIKSLILALSLSPLLLSAWQLPNQAGYIQPESKSISGTTSGNNSGAASFTIFSVPVTIQNGGTTKSGNITITNRAGTVKITVPPDIQNALNTSAQGAVVTLQTGGLTQQQLATLIAAVAPVIVDSTQGLVPGGVYVILNCTQGAATNGGSCAQMPAHNGRSLPAGSSRGQSFPTLAAAIPYVRTAITTLPVNDSIDVKIGDNTIVILAVQAQTPNSSSIEVIKKVVTLKKRNGETLDFEIVGSRDKVNNAAVVAALLLGAGAEPSAAKTSIALVLTGADPLSTTNLILGLNGLVTNQSGVNLTKLNQAINAYNTIVDKADTNSLKALNNTAEFTNIGGLLRNIRAPLG